MHSKSDNIEVIANDNLGEIIEELFDLLLYRYQIVLETQMRVSDCIFVLSYFIIRNSIKQILNTVVRILILQN